MIQTDFYQFNVFIRQFSLHQQNIPLHNTALVSWWKTISDNIKKTENSKQQTTDKRQQTTDSSCKLNLFVRSNPLWGGNGVSGCNVICCFLLDMIGFSLFLSCTVEVLRSCVRFNLMLLLTNIQVHRFIKHHAVAFLFFFSCYYLCQTTAGAVFVYDAWGNTVLYH